MQKILVLGAGRSATDLITYLLEHSTENNWEVSVADMSLELAQHKIDNHPRGKALTFDANDAEMRAKYIQNTDLVVSLLPPSMHVGIAKDCLKYNAHLVTASFVSAEMAELSAEAKAKNLIFLNELGVDPGIDHLSIMKGVDGIRAKGGKVLELRSFCGSLIAPESNDNPWGYKFTWSPMNVILAGQASACYWKDGRRKYVPYNRIFSTIDTFEVPNVGTFDGYFNRDSYSYLKTYGLEEINTLIRGTLRFPGFCEAWNALVKLGLTATEYRVTNSVNMTYNEWVSRYVELEEGKSVESSVAKFLGVAEDSDCMKRLSWAGLFSLENITKTNATPAEILLDLLMQKWVFREKDKDMLVMADKILYEWNGKKYEKLATMVIIGKGHEHTAISTTVGLPAAIGVKLILQGKIESRGVVIPTAREFYEPILAELATYNIGFEESTREVL
jgi:saccharopine dehydrogenase (NADP+, L-glutamate forming)